MHDSYLDGSAQEALWPDFDERWIAKEGDGFVVFLKPEGIPTIGAHPELGDGLIERASVFFERRDGQPCTLHPVQRLDAETSGLMIAATHPTRAKELGEAFASRAVEKQYVAGVETKTSERFEDRKLEHHLRFIRGRGQVVPSAGKFATSHARLIDARGHKALLALRLQTGRTHQLRVQLSHEQAPIAGDRLYGERVAPRLMLHSQILSIAPLGLSFETEIPRELSAWLEAAPTAELPSNLNPPIHAALRRRWHLRKGANATAFRCIHGAGDGLPGLYFDLYGRWGLLHIRSEACAKREAEIVDILAKLPLHGVYIKRRPRQASRMTDDEVAARAPVTPLRGQPAPEHLDIWEHGVRYRTSLSAGMSTGLFLDQRRNRAWLKNAARDKRVLNLFSYTCGFAAAALAGHAREVINIDASKAALRWGEENLQAHDSTRWKNYADDVFKYLARAQRRRESFDIVVVDPPTYATTKTSRFRSGKDWRALVAQVVPLVTDEGVMLCCSNDERMTQSMFRKHIHAGVAATTQRQFVLRDRAPDLDVRGQISRRTQLKSVEVTFSTRSSTT